MNCDGAKELIGGDGGRTLTAVESATLSAHIHECDSCKAFVRESGIDEWVFGTPAEVGHPTELTLPTVDRAHYDYLGMIARGGMGRITKAHDRRLGREVAVKEVLADAYRPRFEREARITARLQHPAIVPIYEAGTWPDGTAFYTMRLVTGVTLADAIEDASLEERLSHVGHLVAVTDALAFAHSKQIIHRDLKPLNVLVGEFGETVVIDWGLARVVGEEDDVGEVITNANNANNANNEDVAVGLTQTGAVLGTPCYMAPEQAAGGEADERTDVYALGAMLYTLLVGKAPYRDTHDGVIAGVLIDVVLRQPPTPILELEPNAPPDLVAIAERAMAPERTNRYRDAREMAAELHRFQAGQLIASRQYRIRELVGRWVARHRAAVTVASIAALMIIFGGAWSVSRIAASRDQERDARVTAEKAQRDLEAQNADLIFRQAASSLQTDPTATLGWLRQYPQDGRRAGAAALLVAEAVRLGVSEHIFTAPSADNARLLFVPEHDLLVVSSELNTARAWNIKTGAARELSKFRREEIFYDRRNDEIISPMGKTLGFYREAAGQQNKRSVTRLPGKSFGSLFEFFFHPGTGNVAVTVTGEHIGLWSAQRGKVDTIEVEGVPVGFVENGSKVLVDLNESDNYALYDVASLELAHTFEAGTSAQYYPKIDVFDGARAAIAMSPGAKKEGGGVSLLRDREVKPSVFHAPRDCRAVKFSPNGSELVAGFADGLVTVIDVDAAAIRCSWSVNAPVTAIDIRQDKGDRVVAIGTTTGSVFVATGCGTVERHLRGHRAEVNAVAISPDGALVASSADDQEVRLHQRAPRRKAPTERVEPGGCKQSVELEKTGDWLWSNCFDPEPGGWIAVNETGGQVHTYEVASRGWLSRDGSTRVGSVKGEKTAVLRDGEVKHLALVMPVRGNGLTGDGRRLFVPQKEAIEVWDLDKLELERRIPVAVKASVPSPDGTAILVDNQKGIAILDADGQTIAQGSTHLAYMIGRWSNDSQVVVAQTGDQTLMLYDRATGQWHQLNTPEGIGPFDVSPSGQRVAVELFGTIMLWSFASDVTHSSAFKLPESTDDIHFASESVVYAYSGEWQSRIELSDFSHQAIDVATRTRIEDGRAASPPR